ncbi:MAG: acyl-CoA/acyl-ACP dehydrogenase [Proteobacteria bacterium]|nr:acyl-CoA/acyl-ACP dehydrogenase [Pseudomonadota bacterium]
MPFQATPMFPGDLYDTTARVASAAPVTEQFEPRHASATWQQFLSIGWQGVLVAEQHGGAGSSLADVAAVAEAAGRHALAVPLVARCAVLPTLLGELAAQPLVAQLLQDIAMGEASACPVLDAEAGTGLRCSFEGDAPVLTGHLRGADLTEPATHFVFLAQTDSGEDVLLLAAQGELSGQARTWLGVDARQTADFALDRLRLPSSALLARGAAARAAAAKARDVGALMSCAQIVGAIGAMIEQSIEYLSTRQQFGVALATFQALRHRTVEMYVAYENVRGMVRQRVLAHDGAAAGAARETALVKLYLSVTARRAAEDCIQLHGGIGMSRELPAARLAMHALACSLQWGDRYAQLDRLVAGTMH